MNNKPLSGIKVLDFTRMLAGPYCTMLLGDLGAEVIKIEGPIEGDPIRTQGPPFFCESGVTFYATNRNKYSCAIDMHTHEGKLLVQKLATKADIIVENFRPEVMKKLGLDYGSLSKENPKIIYASLSGYGADGPESEKGAFDLTIQAVGGYMSITGEQGGAPVKLGTSAFDIVAGMNTHSGILAALIHRSNTGKGQKIETSLLEGEVAFLANVGLDYLMFGNIPQKWGSEHPQAVPYKAFETNNGWLVIGAAIQNLYEKFMHAIDRSDLVMNTDYSNLAARTKNRMGLYKILDEEVKKYSTSELMQKLEKAGVPCAPVNNVKEVFENNQVLHRKMLGNLEHPRYGKIPTIGPAVKYSAFESAGGWIAPPQLGEHTEHVLETWLGCSEKDIASLRENKVFG
jgi:succinate--hydroxymethylglutarate CoA-transferase